MSSYKYITDSPVGALVCSILLGPLGLQGFMINPGNPTYGTVGVHQRRLSYAIIAFLIITVSFFIASKVSFDKRDAKGTVVTGSLSMVAYSGLGVSCFLSLIFAIIILTKES